MVAFVGVAQRLSTLRSWRHAAWLAGVLLGCSGDVVARIHHEPPPPLSAVPLPPDPQSDGAGAGGRDCQAGAGGCGERRAVVAEQPAAVTTGSASAVPSASATPPREPR
jgi:hypothetical protein